MGEQPSRACARCGVAADPDVVGGSTEVTERGERWLCPACTREHVRAIEARLDEAWW